MFPAGTILVTCFSSLILFSLHTCIARHHAQCNPSACGHIRNISFPFRLADDPKHCGASNYELSCENNSSTFLYRNHNKYLVQSIDYNNHTIRLSYPSVIANDTCSLPNINPITDFATYELYVGPDDFSASFDIHGRRRADDVGPNVHSWYTWNLAWPITFLSCLYPQNDSDPHLNYTKADHCFDRSDGRYKYIKVGILRGFFIGDACTVDNVVLTSFHFQQSWYWREGMSPYEYQGYENYYPLSQIHSSLVYGFELSWLSAFFPNNSTFRPYCIWTNTQAGESCEWSVYVFYYNPTCLLECGFRYAPRKVGDATISVQLQTLMEWVIFVVMYIIEFMMVAKVIIGVPILLVLLMYKLHKRHLSAFDVIEGFLQDQNNLAPIRYSYSEIKKMTSGFKDKLGQGGYGSVYKGKLRSGHYVAVKVLSTKSTSNGQDFINEVATIGRVHHVNVVKLVGYCAERTKRALIYDLMPNGSLDKYIGRQETTTDSLSWEKKYEIALGAARGIDYLHRGCDIQILHFDIKPHNILLDENFSPKISDFGLAKFYSPEQNTVILTAARGTIGYVAPELNFRSIGNVSYKADVYSFGMLLMEMVGLNRKLEQNGEDSSQYFPDWIYNHLDKWKNVVEDGIDDIEENITRKMAIVALWCIRTSPGDRPSMAKVMEMLETEVETLQVPPKPSPSAVPQMIAQTSDTGSTWSTELDDSTIGFKRTASRQHVYYTV